MTTTLSMFMYFLAQQSTILKFTVANIKILPISALCSLHAF
jgi:hypothetical protein